MSFFQTNSEVILSFAKLTSGLLIAFAVAPFLKRPALRATFWAGVLIILPTVMIATHGRGALNILPQLSPTERLEVALPVEVRLEQPTPTIVPLSLPQTLPEEPLEASVLPYEAPVKETHWFAIVFFTGVAFSLLPVLISFLRIRFMTKKPAGEAAMVAWEKIRPLVSPEIPLYLTNSPSAPFTAGVVRAAVLLPESSATWSSRRLHSTLYHEAAHISRRDPLVRVLASFVRALLWFHPLVWLAHRQLVTAQEEACDEFALAAGIPPDEYAEDLLETAKGSRNAFGHSLHMARWSQLGSRIRIILEKTQTETRPLTMKTIAIVTFGIAFTTYSLSILGFAENAGAPQVPADPFAENAGAPQAPADPFAENAGVPEAIVDPFAENAGVPQAPAAPFAENTPKNPSKFPIDKLRRIVIPVIKFENVSLEEAIDLLRLKAIEHDTTEVDPKKKGINFVVKIPEGKPMPQFNRRLSFRNVPVGQILNIIVNETKMQYSVEEFAVIVRPDAETDQELISCTFRVPPSFIDEMEGSSMLGHLRKCGIAFHEGSSATLDAAGNLRVTNFIYELDKIEQLFTHIRSKQPKQHEAIPPIKIDVEEKAPENPAKAAIEKKLKTIVIPRLDFEGTSLEEAIDFLRLRAAELDTNESDPEKKGFNIVVKMPEGKPMPLINSLRLRNVPLGVALKYICDLAAVRYEVNEFAIVIR